MTCNEGFTYDTRATTTFGCGPDTEWRWNGMADVNVPACSSTFLTREYAKRNEWVIGEDSQFTHSLAHAIHHLDVNFIHISTYVMQISSSLAQDIFSNWKLLFSFVLLLHLISKKKPTFLTYPSCLINCLKRVKYLLCFIMLD